MIREGSFSIDEERVKELKNVDPDFSREQLIFNMAAQAVEQIFANRAQAKAQERIAKLIVPERFR